MRKVRDMVDEQRVHNSAVQSSLEIKIEAVAEQIREVKDDTIERHNENRKFHECLSEQFARMRADVRETRRLQGPWLQVIAYAAAFIAVWQVTGMSAFMDRVIDELAEPEVYRPLISGALFVLVTAGLHWVGVRKPKDDE